MSNTAKIRALNDVFQTTFQGGKVIATATIAALPEDQQVAIFTAVRTFNDFTADNDPHSEHDFGAFAIDCEQFFWNIDCYNTTMQRGSEGPADPTQTTRVLTIMLASEY
ncbi:MAG: DUF3768 domain-containing protein [Pseudomonadota bacterium]